MQQSRLTDYFHGRKRNSNFQPSKRQKVEDETTVLPENSSIALSALAEQQLKTACRRTTVVSSDKVEHDKSGATVTGEVGAADDTPISKVVKTDSVVTPSKNASSIIKIDTCRNLQQLKKKLLDLSPSKVRASDADDGVTAVKRYYLVVNCDL